MLKLSHLGLSIALCSCLPMAYAEPTTNKCTDGKQITYANMPCEDLGLKSAGPVKYAVTVVPALAKQQNDPAGNSGKVHGEKGDVHGTDVPGDGKIKPISPLLEKLMQ